MLTCLLPENLRNFNLFYAIERKSRFDFCREFREELLICDIFRNFPGWASSLKDQFAFFM